MNGNPPFRARSTCNSHRLAALTGCEAGITTAAPAGLAH